MGNKVNGKNNQIVIKSGSDDMRAFYDFCVDFMAENDLIKSNDICSDELLNWCDNPEIIKLALIDIKNRKKNGNHEG